MRKVEEFNTAYRLVEKNAVLNRFDIEAPEGYFLLNDKMGNILATVRGKLLFFGLMVKMMPKGKTSAAGFDIDMAGPMMDMLGGFTVLRLTGMIGSMNINFTKEELLDLNAQLNKIKKKEKQFNAENSRQFGGSFFQKKYHH